MPEIIIFVDAFQTEQSQLIWTLAYGSTFYQQRIKTGMAHRTRRLQVGYKSRLAFNMAPRARDVPAQMPLAT